jgi:hypothetical protein
MKFRDKDGWPVVSIAGRPITNFFRFLLHTSLSQTWARRHEDKSLEGWHKDVPSPRPDTPCESIPPVDWSARVLTSGEPVPEDRSHTEINPATGQQKAYVVLSDEERAKGFVRPVRSSYVHLKCGGLTTMSRSLSETYAREPKFYSGTFCCQCRAHFPLNEFVWDGTNEEVGS